MDNYDMIMNDDPATMLAQILYFMESWAKLDMDRMAGLITHQEEVALFSAHVAPLAMIYRERIYDFGHNTLARAIEIQEHMSDLMEAHGGAIAEGLK